MAKKKVVEPVAEPKAVSLDIFYMIERLSGVQGWIYRTDGLYVVRTECEMKFRTFMINAGLTPVKLPIKTSMSFMDAITKGTMQNGRIQTC